MNSTSPTENNPLDIMEVTLGPSGSYLRVVATDGESGQIAREVITGLAAILSGQYPVLLRNRYDGESTERLSRNQPRKTRFLNASEDAARV